MSDITFWILGILFTIGYIEDDEECPCDISSWVAFFMLWPLWLGCQIGKDLRYRQEIVKKLSHIEDWMGELTTYLKRK